MNFNIFSNGDTPEGNLRNYYMLLFHSFSDLGHNLVFEKQWLPSPFVNIVINPLFATKHQRRDFNEIIDAKIPYGLMDYEIFSGDSFNHGVFPLNKEEQDFIKKFIENASFIWAAVGENYEKYREINPNTAYIRYGYHERVFEIPKAEEKGIDVFFFGTVSGDGETETFRRGILRLLQESGLSVYFQGCGTSVHSRNSFIRLARINLDIPHLPPFTHVSPQRIVYMANNGICPLSLPTADPEGYLKYARVFPLEELVTGCRAWIGAKEYMTEGERVLALLKQEPMVEVIERVLDETFAR
ncbi:MAG: hypothetical protein F8N37_13305 [Telmatospirillum sp.]|nr:hypothetical protein [Telmatospirillum sp.]